VRPPTGATTIEWQAIGISGDDRRRHAGPVCQSALALVKPRRGSAINQESAVVSMSN
jgi:hypothetical protein